MTKEFVVWTSEASADEFTVHAGGREILYYLNGNVERREGVSDEDFVEACAAVEDYLEELAKDD